jgi:hypothetical protein
MKRRRLDFQDFQAVEKEIDRLQAGGYQKAGSWDLAHICEHLALTMQNSLHGSPYQASWPFRKLIGPVVLRIILRTRQLKTGFPAPPGLRPADAVNPEEAVSRCRDLLRQVREHPGEFQPHPFFGKITADQWRQVHLIHSAHHLGFLVPN